MELSRETIIDKTHYGINIYAYVLSECYPGKTVLSLRGRDCGLTQNPFNEDKETLSVKIINNLAVHSDAELQDFKGDAFDFAQLHFQTNNEMELWTKINEALHLRLELPEQKTQNWWEIPDDTWRPQCSFYAKPVRNVFPSKVLRLHEIFDLITGDTYKEMTQKLRAMSDPKEKRKFKANNFDYVTFSGTFKKRADSELITHSSLLTIDFDHLNNQSQLKEKLLTDAYFDTEMLFTSPSGDGLKWIVRIDLNQCSHDDYFNAIANYILNTYNIKVDASGKDCSRACFLVHDPEAFLHQRHHKL